MRQPPGLRRLHVHQGNGEFDVIGVTEHLGGHDQIGLEKPSQHLGGIRVGEPGHGHLVLAEHLLHLLPGDHPVGAGLDDLRARQLAEEMKLTVVGTLGVLLRAKQATLVPTIRSLLDAVIAQGFRLSSDLYQDVLKIAQEDL